VGTESTSGPKIVGYGLEHTSLVGGLRSCRVVGRNTLPELGEKDIAPRPPGMIGVSGDYWGLAEDAMLGLNWANEKLHPAANARPEAPASADQLGGTSPTADRDRNCTPPI